MPLSLVSCPTDLLGGWDRASNTVELNSQHESLRKVLPALSSSCCEGEMGPDDEACGARRARRS